MSLHYRIEGNSIVVLGNTFPFKDSIKSMGARFDGRRKVWVLDFNESNKSGVHQLCLSAGGGPMDSSTTAESIPEAISNKAPTVPALNLKMKAPAPESFDFMLNSTAENTETPKEGFSIRQIMDEVHHRISMNFPKPIWVYGEIQNMNKKGRGIYLSLAEQTEDGSHGASITVSANIWQNTYTLMEQKHGRDKLDEILVDGTKVRALCMVNFYKGRGNITLVIQDIDPSYTKGALALARKKLLKELRIKGLDQKNKSLLLPAFPFHIGLISAEGSRAESDFTHQLLQGRFPGHLSFLPAASQGEQVKKEVPLAIKQLQQHGCDIIVITRGGGSAADLRWYDTPEVAYAIANCSIPIVAAIGHHDDVSVAELISHQHCKTPTAAAEYVLDIFFDTRNEIEDFANRMAISLERILEIQREKLAKYHERIYSSALNGLSAKGEQINKLLFMLEKPFRDHIQYVNNMITNTLRKLELSVTQSLHKQEQALMNYQSKISSLDPTPWVKKGWTQLFHKGEQLFSIKKIKNGDTVSARLIDGNIEMEIQAIQERNN